MKKLALAAAFAGVASVATAGGMSAPVMETTVMPVEEVNTAAQQQSSSAPGIVIPLALIAVVAAIAGN